MGDLYLLPYPYSEGGINNRNQANDNKIGDNIHNS